MSELFALELSNNVTTIDFMNRPPFSVEDGGFEVSLPERNSYVKVSDTEYIPIVSGSYRTVTIRFSIYGTTRAACLASASSIEGVIRSVMKKANPRLQSNKGQLKYSWDGSNTFTYFKVWGGVFSYPANVLSVEKIHATLMLDSVMNFVISECTLTLYVSEVAYSVSVFSDTLVEVPLWNNSIVSKQTGGVNIKNPADAQYNWVEIDDADLDCDAPLVTRIKLTSGSPYSAWYRLYMGLVEYPFPTSLLYDFASPTPPEGSGAIIANANAHRGYYREYSSSQTEVVIPSLSTFAWSLTNNAFGTVLPFIHSFGSPTNNRWRVATGIDDYVSFGLRIRGGYTNLNNAVTPLPNSMELPPMGKDILTYGTLDSNLWLGMWLGKAITSGTVTLNLDYMSLLPCTSGLRVWVNRIGATSLTGELVDCGWKGIQYRLTGGTVSSPFHAMLSPLFLEPRTTQRIYFTTCGDESSPVAERERTLSVRLYVVPSFSSMAL